MIDRIDLRWFKCFERLELPLASLTLLAGRNASGKSSIFQALAMLQQAMQEHEWSNRLALNGSAVRLGALSDVVDDLHGRNKFEIGLVHDDLSYRWKFEGDRRDIQARVASVRIGDKETRVPRLLRHLLPVHGASQADKRGKRSEELPIHLPPVPDLVKRLLNLSYLTAERIAPKDFYSLEDSRIANTVGPQGEHAVSVLYRGQGERVLSKLKIGENPSTLFWQVQSRMQQIFPDLTIDINSVPDVNGVTLRFATSDARSHRPQHTGFGITQILPVIVAALTASKQDIFLVENPEVHLHPAGQALIGEFLAEVAGAGVQVLIETHSDHILNGVRRAVKSGKLKAEETAIHFFRRRDNPEGQVISPSLDENGNIDIWPDGFFDQFDKDINYFAEWSG